MKWEYIYARVDIDTQNMFIRLGNEGWKLVSVDNDIAYFMRPIKVSEKEDVELKKHKEFIKKLTLQQIGKMNRQEFNRRFSRVRELYNLESSQDD